MGQIDGFVFGQPEDHPDLVLDEEFPAFVETAIGGTIILAGAPAQALHEKHHVGQICQFGNQ